MAKTPEQIREYQREYKKKWRERNPDYWNEYYAKNKGKQRQRQAKYDASEKGKRVKRDAHLRRRYGLPFGEFDRMLAEQNGLCAICGGPPVARRDGQEARLHLDHCHATGRVRALLCMRCNQMLGSCRDDAAILRKGIEYLEKHSADQRAGN